MFSFFFPVVVLCYFLYLQKGILKQQPYFAWCKLNAFLILLLDMIFLTNSRKDPNEKIISICTEKHKEEIRNPRAFLNSLHLEEENCQFFKYLSLHVCMMQLNARQWILLSPTIEFFLLVFKFCADRKKPKLKVGTHPIWEAFFEASLMERDNNSGNSHISISSNLSILEPENTSILCYGCSLSFICLNIIIFVC